MVDIYFHPDYGRLYEETENGKSICWQYEGVEGTVRHQFLIREIPIEDEEKWFDIVTPYGYGGPVIEKVNTGYSRQQLVDSFSRTFCSYCQENRIVSEFVRFHPIVRNAQDFGSVYDAECIRYTLATDLGSSEKPDSDFSKSCRKSIRRAQNKGVSYSVTQDPLQIDDFLKIYYATMERNSAGDYYYFPESYFKSCLEYFRKNMLYVEAIYQEKTIAAMLCFVYDKIIHIHLSGTLTEYLDLSPAYILRYAVAEWGKENGYELIHHGGGKSNAPDDSLFLYKKQFAQNKQLPFYVGRKIWNQEIYDLLCQRKNADPDSQYFPLYRA